MAHFFIFTISALLVIVLFSLSLIGQAMHAYGFGWLQMCVLVDEKYRQTEKCRTQKYDKTSGI